MNPRPPLLAAALVACAHARTPHDAIHPVNVHVGGNVDWRGAPARNLDVRLVAGDVLADRALAGPNGRYDLDADVMPGSWWVRATVIGEGAPWWPIDGPELFVGADATVQCLTNCGALAPQRIVYARLSRAREEIALAWDPVAGAERYAVTLQRRTWPDGTAEGGPVHLTLNQPRIPLDPEPDQEHLLEWSVEAFDAEGVRLGHGAGQELPRGAVPTINPPPDVRPADPVLGVLLSNQGGGAHVDAVLPSSLGFELGLRPADVITAVDSDVVASQADLERLLDRVRPGITCVLAVTRDGARLDVSMRKPSPPSTEAATR
ncbi:MAG: PDZ domain-containing protein [Alphaproteobacteria bacterium]|nr:PDZ domain-containing protein [Alphaproteobacteria bacterium]